MAYNLRPRKRSHKEMESGPGPWFTLDKKPLDRICCFLAIQDKINVSEAFHTESRGIVLSFSFNFYVDDHEFLSRRSEATDMAQLYGHLFKKVIIRFTDVHRKKYDDGWIAHLFSFMRKLAERSQLTAIRFKNLSHILRLFGAALFKYTCMEIARLLASQRQLKNVSIESCMFKYSDGILILKKLISKNMGLVNIRLSKFLECNVDPKGPSDDQIGFDLLCLPNLKLLEIEYRLMFGEKENSQIADKLRIRQRKLKLVLTAPNGYTKLKSFKEFPWEYLDEHRKLDVEFIVDKGY